MLTQIFVCSGEPQATQEAALELGQGERSPWDIQLMLDRPKSRSSKNATVADLNWYDIQVKYSKQSAKNKNKVVVKGPEMLVKNWDKT